MERRIAWSATLACLALSGCDEPGGGRGSAADAGSLARGRALEDPVGFLGQFDSPVILDESDAIGC